MRTLNHMIETLSFVEKTMSNREKPVVGVVLPCFNEEMALHTTSGVLADEIDRLQKDGEISEGSFILFVDDGSKDNTWSVIEELHRGNPHLFHGVKLAHNRGHQNALYAGLMTALEFGVDAAVSMDADLQDDPTAAIEMIRKYRNGAEIVYGVRDNRDTDSFFKRTSAHAFYSFMNILGTETIPDHADYRLMGRESLRVLSEYKEVNLFLRGIVPSLGFPTERVYYKRGKRVAGESKYPLKKMMAFAMEGVTSFSVKPLQIITYIGLLSVVLGIVMLIYSLVSVFEGNGVAGWASIMCSLWIIGGLVLLSLGIVGTYIGRIYLEVKQRPRYAREKTI